MSTDSSNIASFASLGLSQDSLSALARAGFTQPTPIQVRAIPPALAGSDVIGCAATGTGKTAAFALPILERLTNKRGTRALVLAPTRELAVQIADQFERFSGPRGLRCVTLIGGVGMGNQIRGLREMASVIIATPGRLIDHMNQGTAKLTDIEVLVLDEADRMLDMGFKPQLTKILERVPKVRQTMLFSATMAGEVAKFAETHLTKPVRVEVTPTGTTAARATQQVFMISQGEKTAALLTLLAEGGDSTLVFTRTKHRADKVARSLERAGHDVSRIHANRSQSQRQLALDGFRSGKYRILVATDIAARGIDVADIGHVVNYDLPNVPEDYVHRIGRTARASASGRASSLVASEEMPLLRDIERYVRSPVPRAEINKSSPVFQAELRAMIERPEPPRPPPPAHGRGGSGRGAPQAPRSGFSGGAVTPPPARPQRPSFSARPR